MRNRAAYLLLALLLAAAPAPAVAAGVRAVESIGMTVSSLPRSVAFYAEVLGFEKDSESDLQGESWERLRGLFPVRLHVATMKLGAEKLELTEYLTPRGRPAPGDSRSNDRWFQHVAIVVRDMDEAYRRLAAHHVEHISPVPQRLPDSNPHAGGIRAFYFRDPDGHPLELIWFPPGKGDPRWQKADGPIFLGIDHTAIASRDTRASLAFYRDRLGLRVTGGSLNSGIEQERLSAVRGARVRITTLRAESGPGIELLEYLEPAGGRAFPSDATPNDLVHWQTRLRADDAAALAALGLPASVPGAPRVLPLRDPDGHYLEVTGP